MKSFRIYTFAIICSTFPFLLSSVYSQVPALGLFTNHTDVGNVKHRGTVVYDKDVDQYEISGSGKNIGLDHDSFSFLWRKMEGDFILTARASFVGTGIDPRRKIGWMIRSTIDPGSAHVNAVVHGDGQGFLQFRKTAGANTGEIKSPVSGADIIQLEKKGNTYIMSVARFGDLFVSEQVDLQLGNEVLVGLFVCSSNNEVKETGVFENVRIVVPFNPSLTPSRRYIGSHLEVMDVETGSRKIVYSHPESLQAPNWTPDGRYLIYNHNGLLYNFDLATRKPTVINSDFANRNNNDHVISFDGKMLGICHQSVEDQVSIVYVMPIRGGVPRRVTPKGPSYLHGWSPDGRFLVYTGRRDGEYDVYKISVEGGEEIRLTTAKGLDDGPEYSPDGKYIYFNSVRSGSMEIWRMKPDGSDQEQITNDDLNNWFPHISPDGKWIVYLTYNKDVDPEAHPFYKHVYLRLMPAHGGESRVIAYLYGGQGTINVPSWSPDSKKIAFVSNSDLIN
jgi:TolB protein